MLTTIRWPDGKRFAFSVFDDTDFATVENVGPVYALLADLGFRTTKSVWPLAGTAGDVYWGATCEDRPYLDWLIRLQQQGFEIGLHNVSCRTSTREQTIRGIARFKELFGHDPRTFANHVGTDESIYWYDVRLSGSRALLYKFLTRFKHVGRSRGHIPGDPLFWGDVCAERVKYVRNFIFSGMNTLKACPWMPYHDPARPYVNYWYASSPGINCKTFNDTICEAEQDGLEEEGGACIMYAHFANGFCENGRMNPRFRQLLERLAGKGGYFVPVGDLLDYILQQRGRLEITAGPRAQMERRWLWRKIRVGRE